MQRINMRIKFIDDNTEQDVVAAIGNPQSDVDYDGIFHFFSSEKDIKDHMTVGVNDFVVLSYSMKVFHWHTQSGRAKYIISYHDGVKKHGDGSPCFYTEIFSNKVEHAKFIKKLLAQGYIEKN